MSDCEREQHKARERESRLLVATGMFLAVSLLISLVAIVTLSSIVSPAERKRDRAMEEAAAIGKAVDVYILKESECPELQDLKRARMIADRPILDPWGAEYAVICGDDGSSVVVSPGSDREMGTADDIVF